MFFSSFLGIADSRRNGRQLYRFLLDHHDVPRGQSHGGNDRIHRRVAATWIVECCDQRGCSLCFRAPPGADQKNNQRQENEHGQRKRYDALGEHWGVAGNALTLTSICERAGAAAARLPQLRDELGAAAERITRKNRRVSSLLNAHQKVIEELLQALVAIQGGRTESTTGALVNAEA